MKNYLFNPLFEKSCPGDVNFTTGILIKSDIETVWNTVCKAENIKKYFTSDAKHDLDSVGEVLWIWGDEAAVLKVINVVKNEKIVFEWNANSAEYRIKAEFSFENKNGKVKVRIKETGWEMNESGIKSAFANCSGWTEYLNCLKVYIEYKITLLNNLNQ